MTSFPASTKSWTALVDGLDQAKAADVNTVYDEVTAIETALMLNLLRGGYSNTETLAAGKTLTDADKPLQFLDTGGVARDVTLPTAAAGNHVFIIVNTADAAETITVKNAAASTIGTVAQGENKIFVSNGAIWKQITSSGTVESASDTVAGIVELATAAETTTGTDATRAVTPDGLSGSAFGKRVITVMLLDNATALAVKDGVASIYIPIPSELNGMNLVDADAAVGVVSSSDTPTIQIHNVTDNVDMLSTRITIDENEYTSYTAATAAVIDTTKDDVATGDLLRIDCDVAGTGTKGLTVILSFQLP